ncbi:MAG TPA: CAP domain-containing protein [Longimicrobiaceae bacterium]|nr:CAP domain-containing protein [Longimicrobiaceae bacterium]
MRHPRLAAVLTALALAGCTPASRAPAPADAPPTERLLAAEAQVHDLVNAYRAHHGLRRLVPHPHLAEVAREHSRAMAAGEAAFSHEGLDERLRRVGRRVPVLTIGENLYAEQPASALAAWRAVTGWLRSPVHRRAIEEPCWELTGIGAATDASGRIYYTQLFARRLPPPTRSADPPPQRCSGRA